MDRSQRVLKEQHDQDNDGAATEEGEPALGEGLHGHAIIRIGKHAGDRHDNRACKEEQTAMEQVVLHA